MFQRCQVLRNGKLCKSEGSMSFTKNKRPVCAQHRSVIASGGSVQWASMRLLEWDKMNQLKDMAAKIELAVLNQEYYDKEV